MARRSSVVVPSSVTNPIRRLSNVSFVPPPRNMRRMSTQLYGVSPLQRNVTFKEPPTEMTPEAPYAMAGSPMAGISPEMAGISLGMAGISLGMAGMASLGRHGRRMSTDLYKVKSSARPPRMPPPAALGTLSELEVTSRMIMYIFLL